MVETGTADLASLLNQLGAFDTEGQAELPARAPSASEAMAIYSVAVRLVHLELNRADAVPSGSGELVTAREVLRSTQRLLHAALDRLERPATGRHRRFVVINGDG